MSRHYNNLKSPCYDPSTKKDCADRHSGCTTTCEKWAEYETKRNALYEQKFVDRYIEHTATRTVKRKYLKRRK